MRSRCVRTRTRSPNSNTVSPCGKSSMSPRRTRVTTAPNWCCRLQIAQAAAGDVGIGDEDAPVVKFAPVQLDADVARLTQVSQSRDQGLVWRADHLTRSPTWRQVCPLTSIS